MAKQRVMVGELNAPTEVTPTARPVDTYVSPEKPIVQPSPLSQFLEAISPLTNLVKEEAQKEKAQQDRDEFNGRRANEQHQAEMAAINLSATLKEDWITNQNDWLSMSTEQAAEKVSKHYTNYRMQLDEAQINPLALQAFDQKVDEDKLLFMFNNFGPEKRKRNIEQQDQQFNDTIRKAGSVAEKPEQIVPSMVDAFNQHVVVTGGDYRRANDLVIETALAESKKGSTNYIKFVEAIQTKDGKSLRSIDRYAKDFNTIDANIAAFTKAQKTVNKPLLKEAVVNKLVADSISTGNPAGAKVGEKVTVPDGAGGSFEFTVTKEMAAKAGDELFFVSDEFFRNEIEAYNIAKSQGRTDPATGDTVLNTLKQQRFDLEARMFNTHYNPHEIVPARYKLPITAGLPYLQGGDVSEGSQGLAALDRSLKAIRDFKSLGGSMSTLGLSKDQEFKVNSLNALLESGREIRDIAPFASKPIPQDFGRIETLVTDETVRDVIDTGMFDVTNIDEAQIGFVSLKLDVQKQAKAIMFMSEVPISAEEAVTLAIPQVRDNYLTLRTTQWDAFALGDPRHFSVVKKVKGQLNTEANEETLNDVLFRTFENERVKEIIAPRLAAMGSSTTGIFDPDMAFAWQQDSRNSNMLNLMAYAEDDYSRMVQVGSINLQTLTSTSSVAFAKELAEELNKTVQEGNMVEQMSIEAQQAAAASGMGIAVQDVTGGVGDIYTQIDQALVNNVPMDTTNPFSIAAQASTLLPEDKPTELTRAVDTVVSTKNISAENVTKIMETIARHETGGTMDPKTIQRSDKTASGQGPARGLLQYEPERFFTSITRAKEWHKKQGKKLPSWVTQLDKKVKGKTTEQLQDIILELSGQQQIALGIYDLLEEPNADFSKVDPNSPESIADFWVNSWWIGPKGTTQKTKDEMKQKFVASVKSSF